LGTLMREVDEILEDEQLLELVYERLRLRGTNWRRCGGIRKDNTRSESVINGATVLSGATAIATTWKSSTITSKELEMNKTETLVPPVHPGEILREDFMKPLGLTVNKLALARTPFGATAKVDVHWRRPGWIDREP